MLDGSSYAWLGEVLMAFNHGDLHAYDQLCEKHAGALNSQPALVQHERALREKITILALTELIFKCVMQFCCTMSLASSKSAASHAASQQPVRAQLRYAC